MYYPKVLLLVFIFWSLVTSAQDRRQDKSLLLTDPPRGEINDVLLKDGSEQEHITNKKAKDQSPKKQPSPVPQQGLPTDVE